MAESGGVTLSYQPCSCCYGDGFINIPENKEDEKQLELGWLLQQDGF
ncbi:hypothetical protein vBVpaMR16F_6 [Vibrio phage vB_VpaM_R16F]|nr:hypothetical protein vBVpaMR16F_6 [Vibrio phage vB_VpaM_R16F]